MTMLKPTAAGRIDTIQEDTMRLCLNDSRISGPYRTLTREPLKVVHDIGFRVAGIGCDYEASDDDIRRVRDMFGDVGLAFGPMGLGGATYSSDPGDQAQYHARITKALEVGGKLGCPSLRYSVGSMHPTDVWRHHPENHTQKALDLLVDATLKLVPIAEDTRCMLCPETNSWTIVNNPARMREYVDRLDSPYAKIIFDPVNQMNPERVFQSGAWMKCAIATLGDRIGVLHVKDVQVMDSYMINIQEAPMGTGILDHAAIIEASNSLEPWKTFSLEHFSEQGVPVEQQWRRAYRHIMSVSDAIGHTWTDPHLTRDTWESRNTVR